MCTSTHIDLHLDERLISRCHCAHDSRLEGMSAGSSSTVPSTTPRTTEISRAYASCGHARSQSRPHGAEGANLFLALLNDRVA